jgi:hypothetical protein
MRSGVGAVATDLDIFAATSPPRVQVERPCLSLLVVIRMSRHEAWAEASKQVLVEKWLLVHRDLRARPPPPALSSRSPRAPCWRRRPPGTRSWNITHFQRVDSERPRLIWCISAGPRAKSSFANALGSVRYTRRHDLLGRSQGRAFSHLHGAGERRRHAVPAHPVPDHGAGSPC